MLSTDPSASGLLRILHCTVNPAVSVCPAIACRLFPLLGSKVPVKWLPCILNRQNPRPILGNRREVFAALELPELWRRAWVAAAH